MRRKVRRNMYGRKYTTFGYYLHITLCVTGLLSFLLMLGFTGSCENGYMSVRDYLVRGGICTAVFGASILIHNRVFEGRF